MHFNLVDSVIEQTADRIVTIKQVSAAEEYLQDHFPGFPVLPGVMMVEAMVQAARRLLDARGGERMVLGQVRALKYGSFVQPGQTLRIDVAVHKDNPDGSVEFKGEGTVRKDGMPEPQTAVAGRFTLRPLQIPGMK
jgi:3-hydroxyacyl-[acyl-carrier-protein] dehydratase